MGATAWQKKEDSQEEVEITSSTIKEIFLLEEMPSFASPKFPL